MNLEESERMSNALKITDAEFEVMNIIWDHAPMTSSEVIEILSKDSKWKPNTILTLISRLVKKEVLTFEKQGKTYLYSPLVSREQCIEEVGASFVDRFFGGSVMPMLAHFTSTEKLTKEEKQALRELLDSED